MLTKDSNTIERKPNLPKAIDYSFLRKLGMERIKSYSKDLWTDFNDHDPGITLSQLLSYAITDISRRAMFSVKDILAEESSPEIDRKDQFYTASEILASAPVTINDFRKLLADQPGVRNAWLKTREQTEPVVYINPKQERLQYEETEGLERLSIRGLYEIKLELEKDPEHGDLNSFSETIQLVPGEPDQGEIVVQLPHWDELRSALDPQAEIDLAEISSVKSTGRFTFEGELLVKTADKTVDFEFFGKTTIGNTEPGTIKSRIKEEELIELYVQKVQSSIDIVNGVVNVLHQNRNLCEDFTDPTGIRIEEIGVCADIQIAPDVSQNDIMAEIYYRIERLIAPPVNFYSLREMMDRGYSPESIFNGPNLKHGFIDDDELHKSNPKKVIYVSDIIKEIMNIKGVVSIEEISIAGMVDGKIHVRDAAWCLHVEEGRFPRFSFELSKILLLKDGIPYRTDRKRIVDLLEEMQASDRKEKMGALHYDLPVPEGTSRNLLSYTPLQNDLPKTYGVGEYGLDEPLPPQRKAQIKQLRGFLVFFDQLLVNYLGQLSRIRELFSFSAETERTYFNTGLISAPDNDAFIPFRDYQFLHRDQKGVDILLLDFLDYLDSQGDTSMDLNDPNSYRHHWQTYKEQAGISGHRDSHYMQRLNEISEDRETYLDRRDRFLDHLLSRFGEKFTDYAILMQNLTENRASGRIIEDKIRFLKEIPELSSARYKAMNFRDADGVWDTANVAAILKRVARLLGIRNLQRRNLTCDEPEKFIESYQDAGDKWRFRFKHPALGILLSSSGFDTKDKLEELLQQVYENAGSIAKYDLQLSSDGRFFYNLGSSEGEVLARGRIFETREEREEAIRFLVNKFGVCNKEGFYLVEHLLLRPQKNGDPLLPVCLNRDKGDCPGFKDPYSFRISIIIPSWPDRFRNMEFRKYAEQTFRRELPAHVHAKICWADQESLKTFEKSWRKWLKARSNPQKTDISNETKQLIFAMAAIRSVYPTSTLFDCKKQDSDRPTLLDNSIIGTFKPNEL